MNLTVDGVEKMCKKADMSPVSKHEYGDYTVYINDGFSKQPHVAYQRFGVERGDFMFGAFCTIAWISKDQHILAGIPAICDKFHDIDNGWSSKVRQQSRVNFVHQKAMDALNIISEEEKGDTFYGKSNLFE